MSITDWLDGNYNEVECRALEEVGWVAFAAALGSAFTGAWVVTGGAAAVNLAAGAAWTLGGCGDQEPDWPSNPTPPSIPEGQCLKAVLENGQEGGCGLRLKRGNGSSYLIVRELLGTERSGTFPNGTPKVTTTYVDCSGVVQSDDEALSDLWPITTEVLDGYACAGDVSPEPEPEPEPPNPPDNPVGPDIPGPEIDGCNWTLTPVDSYVDSNGVFHFKYKVCPDRAECGECFYYWHTQNGPQYISPVAPDPRPPGVEPREVRDCCDETLAKLDEILAKLPEDDDWDWAAILTLLRLIYELLASPPTFGADTYKLEGICEAEDDDGNQPVFSRPVLGGTFDIAALSRLDAMQDLLQAHLAYKTPTCAPERPKLEGDFRTIHFVSDEKTVDGGTRLRKRFRYRSTSGESLGPIVDHWRDFVWQAGPVCVQHAGSSWGTPQIWAASADEGKRVIRHAAGEAGIDPDQNGRWIVGGSNSSRLGMPGTMRVSTRSGVYRITARDGSDGPPMVAIKQYDP